MGCSARAELVYGFSVENESIEEIEEKLADAKIKGVKVMDDGNNYSEDGVVYIVLNAEYTTDDCDGMESVNPQWMIEQQDKGNKILKQAAKAVEEKDPDIGWWLNCTNY